MGKISDLCWDYSGHVVHDSNLKQTASSVIIFIIWFVHHLNHIFVQGDGRVGERGDAGGGDAGRLPL